MDVTRRCDYACRILRQAYHAKDKFVSITEIAEVEEIPYAFARSIQHDLATEGFIETARGSHGGLRLKVDPAKLSLLEILEAIQGNLNVSPCTASEGYCSKADNCAFHKVWKATDKLLSDFYGSISLKKLIDSDGDLPVIGRIMAGEAIYSQA